MIKNDKNNVPKLKETDVIPFCITKQILNNN